MKVRTLATYVGCYLAPAGLATYAILQQDEVNMAGYLYMLIFLAAPLVILAANDLIAGREVYQKALLVMAIVHTALWLATQALNSIVQVGELYNLLVIPAICILGLLMLPWSIFMRLKGPAPATA